MAFITIPEQLDYKKSVFIPYRIVHDRFCVMVYYRAAANVKEYHSDLADLQVQIYNEIGYTPDNTSNIMIAPLHYRVDTMFEGVIRLIFNRDMSIENTFLYDLQIKDLEDFKEIKSNDYQDADGNPDPNPFKDRKTIV